MEKTKGRFAGTVRVGEKGQIVIPKGARELLKIRPGDTLLLLADEKRGIAITKDDVLLRQFEAILGPENET
ncbi:AbrB/MazE/SpoVT family DNA-binding domain-containing protein [Oscillibacter valericigenes]|uniref:AbrB/MazE/SpoVT family DNA-binding domain-containing protein n=1 Tax=Oscillibacter valericigenes TaxID=351091 RepID=UPI001F208D25|nr:AbrB/MazE/SpoVT family DNA-binding domain-containing protein [Oscillibacter valericigenes]MCF2616848.1 AbrB/MazE/SpoVT family DNA-binding domain-containing protein [Oscillibacter valericigenes]